MKSVRVLSAALLFGIATITSAFAQDVEMVVKAKFADTPVLIKIAKCESQFRQFDENGRPFYNQQGSSAVGVMQIMSSIHQKTARKLGMDLFTLEGNLAYARHLYKQVGTQPWQASAACWRNASV